MTGLSTIDVILNTAIGNMCEYNLQQAGERKWHKDKAKISNQEGNGDATEFSAGAREILWKRPY